MTLRESELEEWRSRALELEQQLNAALIGLETAVRQLVVSIFARGHVLLEGHVGVGKTTLLRAAARGLGGGYQRIEGTVDLMPQDLVYHTHLDHDGRPRVDPGPLLAQGEELAVFFFNEINRARPQVHSLLLRAMAERSVTAFNREVHLPHLQVFADRNRVEKEETFELPGAARDRFLMEIQVEPREDADIQERLTFDPVYHDPDKLIETQVRAAQVPYRELAAVAPAIQAAVTAGVPVRRFVEALRRATRQPTAFGIELHDVDMGSLMLAGIGPRGASMLVRAAKVQAWLEGRTNLQPEDLARVFHPVVAHRVFFAPVYELQREWLAPALTQAILERVPAP